MKETVSQGQFTLCGSASSLIDVPWVDPGCCHLL